MYYSWFANEETKIYQGEAICPRPSRWELVETGFKLSSLGFVLFVLCHYSLSINELYYPNWIPLK